MEFSAEQKAAIDAMIEEATAGLVAKNQQLLAEKKKLQKNAEIDPQVVVDLEAQVEKLQGDLTASQKTVKEATKAAETAANQLKAESGFTQKLLIDNGLSDALVSVGVKEAHYLKAAKAMFAGQAQIVVDGESRIAKIGDKALQEFVKEWAGTDEGKHFISAPENGGGGSQGGSGDKHHKVDLSKLTGAAKLEAARNAQGQK